MKKTAPAPKKPPHAEKNSTAPKRKPGRPAAAKARGPQSYLPDYRSKTFAHALQLYIDAFATSRVDALKKQLRDDYGVENPKVSKAELFMALFEREEELLHGGKPVQDEDDSPEEDKSDVGEGEGENSDGDGPVSFIRLAEGPEDDEEEDYE